MDAAATGVAEPAAPPGVPTGTPGAGPPHHTDGRAAGEADSTLADALDREIAESEAFWARLTKNGIYDTEEQLRDAIDRPGWRQLEAQKRLARDAARRPARAVDPSLGSYSGRSCRQVNVKLGTTDFEALVALAIERDVPPSTMARILLRRSIVEAAGVPASR